MEKCWRCACWLAGCWSCGATIWSCCRSQVGIKWAQGRLGLHWSVKAGAVCVPISSPHSSPVQSGPALHSTGWCQVMFHTLKLHFHLLTMLPVMSLKIILTAFYFSTFQPHLTNFLTCSQSDHINTEIRSHHIHAENAHIFLGTRAQYELPPLVHQLCMTWPTIPPTTRPLKGTGRLSLLLQLPCPASCSEGTCLTSWSTEAPSCLTSPCCFSLEHEFEL